MKKHRWKLMLGVVAFAGVLTYWFWPVDHTRELIEKLGGDDSLQIISQPDRVEAFRLAQSNEDTRDRRELAEFPTTGDVIAVPNSTAKALSLALSDAATYYWPGAGPACIPNYGVRYRFIKDANQVDLLVCYECRIIRVFRNEHRVGHLLFPKRDPGVLIDSARTLFPNDDAIQKLWRPTSD